MFYFFLPNNRHWEALIFQLAIFFKVFPQLFALSSRAVRLHGAYELP